LTLIYESVNLPPAVKNPCYKSLLTLHPGLDFCILQDHNAFCNLLLILH